MKGSGPFKFHGAVDGVGLEAPIKPKGTLRYAFRVEARTPTLRSVGEERPE